MEVSHWLANQGLTLLEVFIGAGSLLATAYSIREETKERRLSNRITLSGKHTEIWKQVYERPGPARVLSSDVDLKSQPISAEEQVFAKQLILHLDDVRQAIEGGMLMRLDGLKMEVRDFFNLPIPSAVWKQIKPYQNEDFVSFIESARS